MQAIDVRSRAGFEESPSKIDRAAMGERIAARLDSELARLAEQWSRSGPIRHFVIDDLLPESWAHQVRAAFPDARAMVLKRSLRELKCVAAQMNRYDPLLEECIYSFQALGVVERIARITQMSGLEPDHVLYAGGISLMAPGHFLNPHIDNSHDKLRRRYRVLNLLYYVSPGWPDESGGNLELWPHGPTGLPLTIASRFNRLVVMLTHRGSWHSVSRNMTGADRCCVSNYYFSVNPIGGAHYYHVTEFRGRPEQPIRDLVLRGDNWLRTLIRTRFPRAFENRHFYDVGASRSPADESGPR